ncbi:MAG: hypothetical protein M3159_09160 [Actinomycetota bacterium]|nr:hypothetical protein [Actinomycetota bacterium]
MRIEKRTRCRLMFGALTGVGLLVLAACGSSTSTTKTAATTTPASSPATTGAASGITIATADVAGVGTVLVNGNDGRTLYLLTSEQGGKLTCTDDNGCTKVWPDTELPAGVTSATPGKGVNTAMLATVKSADGKLYVTYGGYPLYEFSHDSGPGEAKGQGISSFGGTWYVISPAGTPMTAAATTGATSSPSTSSGY